MKPFYEKQLAQMRVHLQRAYEYELRKMYEHADAYGAMAANKLAGVVARQSRVLPMERP